MRGRTLWLQRCVFGTRSVAAMASICHFIFCESCGILYHKKGGAKPMSDHIYAQSEIFAVVRQLLKKYHAESAILFGSYARQEADAASDIDLIVVGGSKFDPTDIFCIAEELHRTMGKAVDVYELREVNTGSAFYRTIMEEGVQIA